MINILLALLAIMLSIVALSTVQTNDGETLADYMTSWFRARSKWQIFATGVVGFSLSVLMVLSVASGMAPAIAERMETLIQEDNQPSDDQPSDESPSENMMTMDEMIHDLFDDYTSDE